MAKSEIRTLIPLDNAAKIMGVNPLHFNSIVSTASPVSNSYDDRFGQADMWFQHDWQDTGKTSRDRFARVLYQAEEVTAKHLGFYPIPVWIEDEEIIISKPQTPNHWQLNSRNARGQHKSVIAKWGMIQELGVQAKTLIEAGATVAYTDADGNTDSYKETATVTVTTTVTDPEEIRVYFEGHSGEDAWEIRPINVSISGGTATITFRRELAPHPHLWEKTVNFDNQNQVHIDGDDDNNFETAVDVYRVYTDDTDQITFHTEPIGSSDTDWTTEQGKGFIRDKENGHVGYYRATYDSATGLWTNQSFTKGKEPDKLTLNYRAGMKNRNQTMPKIQLDPMWERAIVFYAATMLDKELMATGNFQTIFDYQNTDLRAVEGKRGFMIAGEELANPLGTKRAAIALWKMIRKWRDERGY